MGTREPHVMLRASSVVVLLLPCYNHLLTRVARKAGVVEGSLCSHACMWRSFYERCRSDWYVCSRTSRRDLADLQEVLSWSERVVNSAVKGEREQSAWKGNDREHQRSPPFKADRCANTRRTASEMKVSQLNRAPTIPVCTTLMASEE